jgi:choline dehydrogenase-like flavoprotein
MKPRELGGVVDARLNVYGVRGLKVADLSIAPSNVSATTYGTALVIGEIGRRDYCGRTWHQRRRLGGIELSMAT